MANIAQKRNRRKARHERVRSRVSGTETKPRLCVFRSLKHIYAQLIDDVSRRTIISVSSLNPEVKGRKISKSEEAKLIGEVLGKKALDQGISELVFDRGGYKYHGRVKALAEGCREKGLKF
ncbi:MAG: 50S ribosomal protein L18 [Dehalococcoidia bacterium]